MTTPPDSPTCSVLRCPNIAAGVIQNSIPHDPVEAAVCADHQLRVDSGERWDFDQDTRRVLMGDDLAPSLVGWTLGDSHGTPGFTLVLGTADKSFPVFLTPKDADTVLMLLQSRGTTSL